MGSNIFHPDCFQGSDRLLLGLGRTGADPLQSHLMICVLRSAFGPHSFVNACVNAHVNTFHRYLLSFQSMLSIVPGARATKLRHSSTFPEMHHYSLNLLAFFFTRNLLVCLYGSFSLGFRKTETLSVLFSLS